METRRSINLVATRATATATRTANPANASTTDLGTIVTGYVNNIPMDIDMPPDVDSVIKVDTAATAPARTTDITDTTIAHTAILSTDSRPDTVDPTTITDHAATPSIAATRPAVGTIADPTTILFVSGDPWTTLFSRFDSMTETFYG